MSRARDYLDEWNEAVGNGFPQPSGKQKIFHRRMIHEECSEVRQELSKTVDRVALAKELADLVYVVTDCARTYDIDLDAVLQAVHASNMTKVKGGVKRSTNKWEQGKILKGPFYRSPNPYIAEIIHAS